MTDWADDVDWADEALAKHAREGERYDDWQLAIVRTEDALRQEINLHIGRILDLTRPAGIGYLVGEGLDAEMIEEIQRRLAWHENRWKRWRQEEVTGD